MKVYTDTSLRNFEFWSGALDRVKYLTDDELDTIENILEDMYPDGMDETDINDTFWFEEDWIAEMLGYSDFEELMHRDDEEEDEEEEDFINENFIDDEEKMRDFYELTKDEFLASYSYLTEEEYDNTAELVNK